MFEKIREFIQDDDGAVTVDWVVLTAAVVALNVFMIVGIIENGIEANGNYIDDKLAEAEEYISDPANSISRGAGGTTDNGGGT